MSGHGEVLQQAALDAIEDNGEPIKLVRVVHGQVDPATGIASETRTEYPCMAIVAKASGGMKNEDSFASGTLIETNLRTVTVAALDLAIEPTPGDIAVFDATDWAVVGVTAERAEGLNIVSNMTVKR